MDANDRRACPRPVRSDDRTRCVGQSAGAGEPAPAARPPHRRADCVVAGCRGPGLRPATGATPVAAMGCARIDRREESAGGAQRPEGWATGRGKPACSRPVARLLPARIDGPRRFHFALFDSRGFAQFAVNPSAPKSLPPLPRYSATPIPLRRIRAEPMQRPCQGPAHVGDAVGDVPLSGGTGLMKRVRQAGGDEVEGYRLTAAF